MQVYALDKNLLISALQALKGKDYFCPECRSKVRLRGGKRRQSHFYHLRVHSTCRLSQKGLIHLRLQQFIHHLFEKEAEMEKSFPEIGRITDVACVRLKKIFEIQYSPMSLEEAKSRCADYESLGFQVIWILHDHTFNQKKVGPAESFLRTKTCYFSNMDERGNGMIYDQLDQIENKKRTFRGFRTQVLLGLCKPLPPFKWPPALFLRAQSWALYHQGDLLDLALKGKFLAVPTKSKKKLYTLLKEAYRAWLDYVLEKNSK